MANEQATGKGLQENVFPSIYEHLRRGKSGTEDLITNAFFAHIAMLGDNVRKELLDSLGFTDPSKESKLQRIDLWHTFQVKGKNREVDAVLQFHDKVVLVEDKFDSPLDLKQLTDELELGTKEFSIPNKRAIELLVITVDSSKPSEITKLQNKTKTRITWLSWSKCVDIIHKFLMRPDIDALSKPNLIQLIQFMESKELEAKPPFSSEDEYVNYVKLFLNIAHIIDEVKKLGKAKGFGQASAYLTDEWESYGRAFDGMFYSPKSDMTWGFYFSMGLIEGIPQVEYAWYAQRLENRFGHLISKGYQYREKEWADGNKRKYDYYSKFFPIEQVYGKSFSEQRDIILSFVGSCLQDYALQTEKPANSKRHSK